MNNTRMYRIDGNDTWTMACQNSSNTISATCEMNGTFYSNSKIVPSCAMETYSTADPGTARSSLSLSTLGERNVEVNDKDASSIPVLVYVISAAVLLIIISTLIVALVISLICKFLLNIFL